MVITTAVILAAGEGSRLRGQAASKPLCPVAGRPLIDHAIAGLTEAGMDRIIVVLGYRAEDVEAHLHTSFVTPDVIRAPGSSSSWGKVGSGAPAQRGNGNVVVQTARSDPKLPNGVSVLAAAPLLAGEPALLVMCDHLVEPALYARVAAAGAGSGLTLGIDRRLGHSWVDPDDVTCVATEDDRIVAIGKGLEPHDAYDTGVFAIGPELIAALRTLDAPSLTEGVRRLATTGDARVVDVSDLAWIDVDDAPALLRAEEWRGSLAAA